VQHVLRMNYNAVVPMVSLEAAAGLAPTLVTPWHPVHFAGEWRFPCSIRRPSPFHVDFVYNVVLSTGHVIVINGLRFITLSHGIDSHPVLAHAFFGTQAVVRAMIQRDNGQGLVTVRGVVRDETGLVCGFYDEEQPPCLLLAGECSQILQVSCQ
jgi:hypothetical protein